MTGNNGHNAFSAFYTVLMEVVIKAAGAVKEAFERYKAGEVQSTDTPDVPGQWRLVNLHQQRKECGCHGEIRAPVHSL